MNNEERGLEEGRVMEDLLNDFPSVIPLNVKKSLLDLLSKNDDKDKNTHGNITLNTIRSKINEIETSGNEKVASDNLKTLKKLTFDIEDIITACSHEILKNNIKEKVCVTLSIDSSILTQYSSLLMLCFCIEISKDACFCYCCEAYYRLDTNK